MRRFVVVGTVAAGLQMALLWLLVDWLGLNYLVAALVAIEASIVLSYVLNNAWTFRGSRNAGRVAYLSGLLKTNVVRGSAIPIQIALLFLLVEWRHVPYLVANAVAIVVSGFYRYVLDARWTWG
jgi:putative flippase GtrA